MTLAALLELEALHQGASVVDVASTSLDLTRRDPRLRAQTELTQQVSDLDSVNPQTWEAFWRKNPLKHLTDKDDSLFRLTNERLEPSFSVPSEHVAAFSALVAEIVEWRLHIYLRTRSIGGRTGSQEGRHDRAKLAS